MNDKIQAAIEQILGEEETILLADGFEEAFVGIARQFGEPIAIYDRAKCIQILSENMSWADAEEYFAFNVEGAYVGENTPGFLEIPIDEPNA